MPFLKRETKTFLRKMLGALEGGAGVRIRERERRGREGKKERFVKRVGRET